VLAQDQFKVETSEAGIIRCVPQTAEATSAYKTLQLLLLKLVDQVPGAPRAMFAIDGVIGPSTALAVQVVAGRLAETYQELTELASAQPEEAIPYIGQSAMEIADVFEKIMERDTHALVQPPQLGAAAESVDPVQMLKGLLTAPRLAAAGVALAGISGLAIAAYASDRRMSGLADRSSFLPESDGTDQFDEDAYDGGDEDEQNEADNSHETPDENAHAA
jgi:hypothetical protein